MNEEAKTGIFWAVAVAMAALAAFVAWPTRVESEVSQQIGKVLFEDFKDPLTAASMKIVTFDEEQSEIADFEVAKGGDGVWRIPTHGGYPADAEDQMKKAATLFLGNRILDVSSTNREDHPGFGVVDPTGGDVQVGSEGVGRLVTIKDDRGGTMVSLIVGNEVEGQPGQRYVRRPGQDIVYAVELNDDALTTKFTDWIEEDLLKLASFDIAGVTMKNYTASAHPLTRTVQEKREFDAELAIEGSQWDLVRLQTYKQGTSVPRALGEDEALNTEKLNEMKQALDDLKIVDVGRKPEGMSANLKASKDIFNDETALRSLNDRGFIPAGRAGSDETEILAANGELAVHMNDGIRYILRFGDVAGLSEEEQEASQEGETGLVGSNRYLLVTTEVDESSFPMPELQPIPQTIEELDAPAQTQAADADAAAPPEMTDLPSPAGDAPAGEPASDGDADGEGEGEADAEATAGEPAGEADTDGQQGDSEAMQEEAPAQPETPEPETETDAEPTEPEAVEEEETEPADESAGEGEAGDGEAVEEGEAVQEASGEGSVSGQGQEAEQVADEAAPADEEADDADAENPAADESAAEDGAADEEAAAKPAETEQEKQERLEAAQERITKENQRKLDEREEQLEAARKRVAELNARFADWYYEISESTFGKLQLSLDELIVKEGEQAAQGEAGQGGFNGLPGGLPNGLPSGFPGVPQQ